MTSTREYLFTSRRLGFRKWLESDSKKMTAINSNENVMQFFPTTASEGETQKFIKRMENLFEEKGYCYFAVDLLASNEFIGFIGLNDATFEASFTPAVDIGWRLSEKYWGQGYATEGAKRCLIYAFECLNISEIISVAPGLNLPSISVMEKIGMTKRMDFKHPLLKKVPHLEKCVCYTVKQSY